MSTKPLSSLTIFFPAYYDEHTVEPLTRASIETARKLTDDFEIIILDDKSPDRSGEIADKLASEFKEVRVIHHTKNQGVGKTMLDGYRSAAKDYVFYTDGDMQYDVRELSLLAEHVNTHDLVIGYRIKRAEGWTRLFTSRCFKTLIFLFFQLNFKDIDASFKLIKRHTLERMRFYTEGGLIDAEMLIQAKRLKIPVKEIGVHHQIRRFGSSQCLKLPMIFSMLRDIVRLRLKLWGFK